MQKTKLSRSEAAAYLGIQPATLNKWASIGKPWVPFYRIGKKCVYEVADLDAYLAKHLAQGRDQ